MGRLSDFYVIVSDAPLTSTNLDPTLNQPGVWDTFQSAYPDPNQGFEVNRTGRYVRIQFGHTGQLNLAEIMVMAYPGGSNKKHEIRSVDLLPERTTNILIFPVPFTDKLVIDKAEDVMRLEILNVFGEVLLMKECNDSREEILTEQLENGIYLIRFLLSDGTFKTYTILKSFD